MTDKARIKRLKDFFCLTVDEWEKVNSFQNGKCWFCKKSQKSGKRLAVDHSHKSGLLRALLCSQCNRLLGKIESNGWTEEILLIVIYHLKHSVFTEVLGRDIFTYPGRLGTKKHRAYLKRLKKRSVVSETSLGEQYD